MAQTGQIFQTSPPYYISSARREEIAREIQRLPAYARQLDTLKAAYERVRDRMNGPQRDTVATALATAETNFTRANNAARAAFEEARRTPGGLPDGADRGVQGFETIALAVGSVVAIAIVVFFGATLGPFLIAIGALAAALLAAAAVLSAFTDVQDRLPDVGPIPGAIAGLGGLAILGIVAFFLMQRGKK